jgi:hypothetical protein
MHLLPLVSLKITQRGLVITDISGQRISHPEGSSLILEDGTGSLSRKVGNLLKPCCVTSEESEDLIYIFGNITYFTQ